jgi:hypothetical protein
MAKNRGNRSMRRKLDTVGVAGSIPVEPTISKKTEQPQVIEITDDLEVVPALDYRRGRFRLYRVLAPNSQKRCDFGVTSRRAKKLA